MTVSVRWTAAWAVFVAFATPLAASAQSEPPDAAISIPAAPDLPPPSITEKTGSSALSLAELEASLSLSRDKTDRLKREIEEMKGDRDKQNAALIAAGERVRLAETDVAAVQGKIGDLIVQELDTRGRLDGADASISNVLAALERISRNPPPALIVDPSDALGSARSAILISAILPQLRAKAEKVVADLKHLTVIKAGAQSEEANLQANFDILEEEQLRIATLLAAKKQSEVVVTATLAEEEKQAAAMADKAAALKTLIADLGKQAQAVATAADATARANAGSATPKLDDETVRLALANTARQEPAVPFASAKGFLAFPVGGVSIGNYGDGDGFGGISRGLSVVTRAGAPVLAPADGRVIYRGAYLNYGQIVILDAGQDYTLLLAGLASIDVEPGQFVLLGQKLGIMGARAIGRTVAAGTGDQRPTLYIEIRNKNVPMDPTGWWAPPDNTTQSG